jgi:hypothetical protein
VLVCSAPEFIPWRPDFSSSEQASPDWTRLFCGGVQLSNAVNAVDWFDQPAVQVDLCESCGFAGCESGGYVHVSRLGNHVLWTRPHIDENDPFEAYQYRAAEPVRRNGGVAISADEWDSWDERLRDWPLADRFPATTRADLFAAWYLEAPARRDLPEQLLTLAHEWTVASDPSPTADALEALASLFTWFTSEPDATVEGELVDARTDGATVETLYLDVPDTFNRPTLREWPAFSRRGQAVAPFFGGSLALAPAPLRSTDAG